jgi:hypothetical protein
MAFSDPITITINAVNKTLARQFQPIPGGPSLFGMADESFKAEISHQLVKGKRERHLWKVTQKAITANPFIPAENVENYASCYLVLDNPRQGFTDVELQYLVQGTASFIASVTGNRDKLINGEA